MDYELINEINSTNIELHKRLINGKAIDHGYCLAAEYQTNGHGQANNNWESERGKNLLFSILLHPVEVEASQQFVINEIVTLAIVRAIQKEIKQSVSIKWPNDIYVGDKKLCGILIENTLCGSVIETSIIGVGININQECFISDAPNPVSLTQLSRREHDRYRILNEIHCNILNYYAYLAEHVKDSNVRKALHREYMDLLYRRSGFHEYSTPDGEHFSAEINDIGPQGIISLKLKNGEIRQFAFKEIIFISDNKQ